MTPFDKAGLQASDVLARLSEHLATLAKNMQQLEETAGDLLAHADVKDEASIIVLQSLDYTRQSLEDCSMLVQHISQCDDITDLEISGFDALLQRLKLDITRSFLTCRHRAVLNTLPGEFDAF